MSSGIIYKSVQPSVAISEAVFSLQEQVYGDSTALRQRWEWEFMNHPKQAEIKLYCAEYNGQLVGLTVRHPVFLQVQDARVPACFASNSMVRPDMRGQGIIQNLYQQAAEDGGDIQLSKGTAEGMYSVLKKFGYQDVIPNTYQVCILDPVKWVVQRFFNKPGRALKEVNESVALYNIILHGEIPDDVTEICCDGVLKDAQYLAWRYRKIPHKQYHIYIRRVAGSPVSFLVLRYSGNCAYLVDIIWDKNLADEPAATIRIAKKEARRMGASKMVAWATHKKVRTALRNQVFFDRSESPHFSYYCLSNKADGISWNDMNFVHGDGDLDYL